MESRLPHGQLDIRPLEAYHDLKPNYCIGGSCEVPLPWERYLCTGPGMLSVDCSPPAGMMHLPLGEYVGLEIVIDLEELDRCGEPAAWTDCRFRLLWMPKDQSAGAVTQSRTFLTLGQRLSDRTRSIANIVGEAGCENRGKFGAVFCRETGVTPLEFRRRYRSNTTLGGENL